MRSVSAGLDALKILHWDVLYSINHSLKIKPRCHASLRTTATRLNFDCKLPGDFPSSIKPKPWDSIALPCAAGANTLTECWIARRVIRRRTKHKLLKGSLHIRVSFRHMPSSTAFVNSRYRYQTSIGSAKALGSKKRKTGIDYVGVHAGITVTYIGVGYMMKLVAERQRSLRREKKLHA